MYNIKSLVSFISKHLPSVFKELRKIGKQLWLALDNHLTDFASKLRNIRPLNSKLTIPIAILTGTKESYRSIYRAIQNPNARYIMLASITVGGTCACGVIIALQLNGRIKNTSEHFRNVGQVLEVAQNYVTLFTSLGTKRTVLVDSHDHQILGRVRYFFSSY
ncbi:hypothetical protein DFA_01109 [Cavenderia fasciculata]|uniref:Transmembrane protein n=1 Tax=Cavenderia fasciculata TaxID=261658 RepID=F4PQW9_CACFS|nr:uncharacterized protein DFA_01109 [Cavenderia fasciculata]EGG21234.1 hypothetical protein DFA_01109 [Cavenderia fasciculata]|eukprot:XP_004359084.1 hypothetical protein DFA_01109 [Cavenderia fasciculata]